MDWFRLHRQSVESMIPGVRLSFHEFSLFSPVSMDFWPPKRPLKNHRYLLEVVEVIQIDLEIDQVVDVGVLRRDHQT